MRFTVLSSGSKGNALLVQSGETSVLIEAGVGPRVLKQRMEMASLSTLRPNALIVTHGHYDHARRATEVAEALNIPTYASAGCAAERPMQGATPFFAHREFNAGTTTRLGSLTMTAFATPHDAPGSIGVILEDGDARVGVVTDLGCVTHAVVAALRDCNLLYAEFNHDVPMLNQGPYPLSLKRRCLSNVGHLSNEQGATLVARSRTPELRTLVLAHLSESNNTPALALAAARGVVDGAGVAVHVAPQRLALGPLRVERPARPRPAPQALAFPALVVPPTSAALLAPPSATVLPRPALPPLAAHAAPVYAVARVGARKKLGPGPSAQLSLFGAE